VKYQTAGKLITVPRRLTIRTYSERGVGVVGHNILHHHEENVGGLSDFLCGICHTANFATPQTWLRNMRSKHRLDLLISSRPPVHRHAASGLRLLLVRYGVAQCSAKGI
jgi:hypothetical protein